MLEIIIGVLFVAVILLIVMLLKKGTVSKEIASDLPQQYEQLKSEYETLKQNHTQLQYNFISLETTRGALEDKCKRQDLLLEKNQLLEKKVAKLEAQNEFQTQQIRQLKIQSESIFQQSSAHFETLAQKIIEEKTASLNQSNTSNIKTLLEPLQHQIVDFKRKVEDVYDKESQQRFSLQHEIQRLVNMSQKVSEEANNLTTALKGNNKLQGNWGEMILESILVNSGLSKNREFYLQEALRDESGNVIRSEDGKAMIPDAMVVFPDGRKIVIDSKVSLVAWERYVSGSNSAEDNQSLQEHLKSLKQHIDGLSSKNYPHYAGAIDMVLMFVPIEPAFLEALREDASLWQYAYKKKIVLVCPTNLYAVLKIVGDLWKVEMQNQNALKIAQKAGAILDKFVTFYDTFEKVGKSVAAANDAFHQASKTLKSGNANVVKQLNELSDMGVVHQKKLPKSIEEITPSINNNFTVFESPE